MTRTSILFTGVFACFALSLGVCVLAPNSQLGALVPDYKEEDGLLSDVYPVSVGGLAAAGREVYVSQGCQSCHSQVVRGTETSDVERGWGIRRTVARDYLHDIPPVTGVSRLGPDLTNLGTAQWRNEPEGDLRKPSKRDAQWQYLHLYYPTAIIKESNMPPYRHLFETRKITGSPSPDALTLPASLAPRGGYEVVPGPQAKALIAYLMSLDRSHPLKEAGAVAAAQAKK